MVDDAKERLYMKDLYCSYYTESDEITSYMISKLNIKDNDIILEPSAGEGIFIDGIINQQKNIQIDALDINEKAVNILKKKYWDMPNVKVRLTDTLLDRQLDMYADSYGLKLPIRWKIKNLIIYRITVAIMIK